MIPVLEVGGTHVSAALVDPRGWRVAASARLRARRGRVGRRAPRPLRRGRPTPSARPPAPLGASRCPIRSTTSAASRLFEGVGKFAALRGVDVGDDAARRLARGPLAFLNDADAFLLGEWVGRRRRRGRPLRRPHARHRRRLGLAGRRRGRRPGLARPAAGCTAMDVGGRPLEDVVSRRAIRRAYASRGRRRRPRTSARSPTPRGTATRSPAGCSTPR